MNFVSWFLKELYSIQGIPAVVFEVKSNKAQTKKGLAKDHKNKTKTI